MARKKTGTIPTVTESAGAYSELVVPIYFGRKAKDRAGLLRAGANFRLELDFGTLVAATGFVTGTVNVTVYGTIWDGPLPPEYVGALGQVEVEDKATGTGRAIFDLHKGFEVAGFLIEVATITTVTTVTLMNKNGSPVLASSLWRDILNSDNFESDKETAETTLAMWDFTDQQPVFPAVPSLTLLREPVLIVERGGTTTVTSVDQISIFKE
jgi:hypothetical protein